MDSLTPTTGTPIQIAAAIATLAALGFLIWRLTTRVRWIERIPFVLDVAVAVGVASTGSSIVAGSGLVASVGAGALAAAMMAAALVAVYGVAIACGRIPGMSGVELRMEVEPREARAALRWLRHRLAQHGFEEIVETGPTGLSARQGLNKMQWDRKVRPKRLTANVEATPEGAVAHIELKYVPPALGLDRYLRPIAEALREEPSELAPDVRTTPVAPPLEFLVVLTVLVLFAMITAVPR